MTRARSQTVGIAAAAAIACITQIAAQTADTARDAPVVTIGGFVITEADVDAWSQQHDAASHTKLQQEHYDAAMRAVDALVGDYVIGKEADLRHLTIEGLLAEELPKRTAAVTDDEVLQAYQRALPLPAELTFDQMKPTVTTYLQQQHAVDAKARYIRELRDAANVTIRLPPPRQAIAVRAGDPAIGPSGAPIELVEFSDFECPFCRQLEPVLAGLRAKYGDALRITWKDFPLRIHEHARAAAEAARCAADQGQFWRFHDLLFRNQQALGAGELNDHAKTAGIDVKRFSNCIASGVHAADIAADIAEATRQGVDATPTVFINGRPVLGARPIDAYEAIIQEELARYAK